MRWNTTKTAATKSAPLLTKKSRSVISTLFLLFRWHVKVILERFSKSNQKCKGSSKVVIFVKSLSVILIHLVFLQTANAEIPAKTAQMILIGEGANQGLNGMTAIGEVLRRRNSTSGFCTLRRPNFQKFVQSQPEWVHRQAEKAWKLSEKSNLTKGADHYENTKAFGVPSWAKSMIPTVTIKDHKFWRSK